MTWGSVLGGDNMLLSLKTYRPPLGPTRFRIRWVPTLLPYKVCKTRSEGVEVTFAPTSSRRDPDRHSFIFSYVSDKALCNQGSSLLLFFV